MGTKCSKLLYNIFARDIEHARTKDCRGITSNEEKNILLHSENYLSQNEKMLLDFLGLLYLKKKKKSLIEFFQQKRTQHSIHKLNRIKPILSLFCFLFLFVCFASINITRMLALLKAFFLRA